MSAHKNNKYALGNNGGAPPTFEGPEQLEEKCLKYFEHCIKDKVKQTITGLTLYVGFCSRSSWDDYSKKKEFSYIVKRAKLTVENSYEEHGGTIDIFALKQMGWKDRTEIEQTNKNFNMNSKELSKEDMKEFNTALENDF